MNAGPLLCSTFDAFYFGYMEISARNLAELLNGVVEGDENALVNDLSKIEEGRQGTLTFLANPAYTEYIYKTGASIAIVPKTFMAERKLPAALTLIRVEDPRMAFGQLLELYSNLTRPEAGAHPSAVIGKKADIHPSAYIGPLVVVEDGVIVGEQTQIHARCHIGQGVSIGAGTIVHSGVHIASRCVIGKACVIQPGAVIGGDGFGFAPNRENEYAKIAHVGNVVLEDHVEIGANTTIDRATLGSTVIRKGVKLDNLIQIAHNVEVGENTVIAAQTGIAGSTKIGRNCMIGGQVGIVGHINIADEVKIAAQSGVGSSIHEKGTVVQGSPAIPIRDFKKSYVHFKNLHDLAEAVERLSKK